MSVIMIPENLEGLENPPFTENGIPIYTQDAELSLMSNAIRSVCYIFIGLLPVFNYIVHSTLCKNEALREVHDVRVSC